MNVVIQCAATKPPRAGCFQQRDGRPVLFVAHPEHAPMGAPHAYARPDDTDGVSGRSWRDELLSYNAKYGDSPGSNPFELLPAWELYTNPIYESLATRFGLQNTYILSAGWGLIRADFLTPKYDITFSAQADRFKRRRRADPYEDLRMLPSEVDGPVVFFVGKAYVLLACQLTEAVKAPKHLFYNSANAPEAPGWVLHKYVTKARTNWHYQCAKDFLRGEIGI